MSISEKFEREAAKRKEAKDDELLKEKEFSAKSYAMISQLLVDLKKNSQDWEKIGIKICREVVSTQYRSFIYLEFRQKWLQKFWKNINISISEQDHDIYIVSLEKHENDKFISNVEKRVCRDDVEDEIIKFRAEVKDTGPKIFDFWY